jgi:hypothetical protein
VVGGAGVRVPIGVDVVGLVAAPASFSSGMKSSSNLCQYLAAVWPFLKQTWQTGLSSLELVERLM